MRRWPSLSELRAAKWAALALRDVRRELVAGHFSDVRLRPPPRVPMTARRGVEALLRRRRHSCLEGAIVRQRWLDGHDVHRDIVIGISWPPEGFVAHAWLEGEEEPNVGQFSELTRLAR